MRIPPQPKTEYILDNEQDQRMLAKLNDLALRQETDEDLIRLLYSQLEKDWRTPLEEHIDKLLQ